MNWHNIVTFWAIASGFGALCVWLNMPLHPTRWYKQVFTALCIVTTVFGSLAVGIR